MHQSTSLFEQAGRTASDDAVNQNKVGKGTCAQCPSRPQLAPKKNLRRPIRPLRRRGPGGLKSLSRTFTVATAKSRKTPGPEQNPPSGFPRATFLRCPMRPLLQHGIQHGGLAPPWPENATAAMDCFRCLGAVRLQESAPEMQNFHGGMSSIRERTPRPQSEQLTPAMF